MPRWARHQGPRWLLEGIVRVIETDYLVVGAGASGMAFVDALLAGSGARVVMVDRQHRPGGHWLDAYPFVRLHQPSANYGVASRRLGEDRIDMSGINAGFYERATADEICDYFGRVMDADFVGSGRVQFLAMSEYRGEDADGHHVVSLLTGADTVIRAGTVVDATYVQSEIPSRRRPAYHVDPDARVIPPNNLIDVEEPPGGFTVIGCGKTAMDTCNWLLDVGVDPERIQWIRPRDPWLFNRTYMQPLELVGGYMQMQARWVEAAAAATDGPDFARRLEASEVFLRIDLDVEPTMFRGATISLREIDALRSIERVVRKGKVRSVARGRIMLDDGDVTVRATELCVDCTAPGVRPTLPRPIFRPDRITLQYVTIGIVPWSAATVGMVEATREDITEKNTLCQPLTFSSNVADIPSLAHAGMAGLAARGADPDVGAWTNVCRLNPAAAAMQHINEPQVAEAFSSMASNFGSAMANLARLTAALPAQRAADIDVPRDAARKARS